MVSITRRAVPLDGAPWSRRAVLAAGLGGAAAALGIPSKVRSAGARTSGISGPLPDSQTKGILVWDVDGVGYAAEEYFLSGRADVYRPVSMADSMDVASRDNAKDLGRRDFSRELLKPNQPFTTRLIVYRPRSKERFSGNVIVETLHPSGGGTGVGWGALQPFFTANGDAYVGVQHPLTIAGVKSADPDRYEPLAAADPTQLWGMLAQAGAAIKAGSAGGPLGGYAVKHLLLTGYSYTGVATATFANYHHRDAKLADGRNVFDAYLPMGDAQYVRPLDVPVMRLNTQSDYNGFGGLNNRRPDDRRYRHYEVAGASHVALPPPSNAARAPVAANLPAAPGQPHFSAKDCQASFPAGSHPNDYPLYVVQAAMFQNMYRWLDGHVPPDSMFIETNPDGSTLLDEWGNAKGGVRLPQVALPVATYGVGSTQACALFGYTAPFDGAKCRALYGDREKYAARVSDIADQLVAARLILPDGAARLVAMARADTSF